MRHAHIKVIAVYFFTFYILTAGSFVTNSPHLDPFGSTIFSSRSLLWVLSERYIGDEHVKQPVVWVNM